MANKQRQGRMIHIRLSEDEHRTMRILSAQQETTIQSIVASLVQNYLNKTKVSLKADDI